MMLEHNTMLKRKSSVNMMPDLVSSTHPPPLLASTYAMAELQPVYAFAAMSKTVTIIPVRSTLPPPPLRLCVLDTPVIHAPFTSTRGVVISVNAVPAAAKASVQPAATPILYLVLAGALAR